MRVIAGSLGGRRLVAPRGRDTRPTPDRVREAIFSSLGSVTGARVLDLYAGSGALGIEALSRGAEHVVFVEKGRGALAALGRNLTSLELTEHAEVLPVTVGRAVHAMEGRRFDLVLADPPYARSSAAAAVIGELVGMVEGLAPGARIVLEHASRDTAPEVLGAALDRTRKYGGTAVSFYEVAAPSGPVPDC
jgi:16S rRNA (guanine966-N2)-methyltransferase